MNDLKSIWKNVGILYLVKLNINCFMLDTVVSPVGKQTNYFSSSSNSNLNLNEVSIFLNWRCPGQTNYDKKCKLIVTLMTLRSKPPNYSLMLMLVMIEVRAKTKTMTKQMAAHLCIGQPGSGDGVTAEQNW